MRLDFFTLLFPTAYQQEGIFWHLSSPDVKLAQAAIGIYEQVARESSEGASKYSARDYLFRSALLSLLLEVQGHKDGVTQEKLIAYEREYPIFKGGRGRCRVHAFLLFSQIIW
jgi:hypothetical protein